MDPYKKLIIKTCLLALLLLAMHFLYVGFFYETDLQKYSPSITLVQAIPEEAPILYIGESSNNTTLYKDADERTIGAFIGDHYPDMVLAEITRSAAHAGIFLVLLENIPAENPLNTLIVTLNLRSFNAQWIYSRLETPLQKEMVLLRRYPPLINRFLLSFKAYDIKTEEERSKQIKEKWEEDLLEFPYEFPYKNVIEWDRAMATTGIKNPNGTVNAGKTELATHYIKAYAFQIDTLNNPRIKDLENIIKLAEKRNWNLVFNLLAENTEKAGELLGKDLLFLMEENRKLLVDYFTRRGVVVVDNFYDVGDDQFVDVNWTTEHYAELGRRIVARNVADSIRKFFPAEYVPIDTFLQVDTLHFYRYHEIRSFQFFDLPEKYWINSAAITRDKAFSGEFSSPAGQENPYSITFTCPLADLPDIPKHKISIRLKVLQASDLHKTKLFIQLEGEKTGTLWEGVLLREQISSINEWEDFSYSYYFTPETKKADILKIYVYNPSDVLVYVDDFVIEME